MDYLERLKFPCKLDAKNIQTLSKLAFDLEQKCKNTSNIMFTIQKDFLLETRQKIYESDLDTENDRNLAYCVISKIDEMMIKMNTKSTQATEQVLFPEPQSGDIFKANGKGECLDEMKLPQIFLNNEQETIENYQRPSIVKVSPQLPFIFIENLRFDHNLPRQIIPIFTNKILPPRFSTVAFNPTTNCYHWYDGLLLDQKTYFVSKSLDLTF